MSSTIIVDAMGGDSPLDVPVQSSVEVCKENPGISVILVGNEKDILDNIDGGIPENLKIVNADVEITMDDNPSKAFRKKGDSSIHKGIDQIGRAHV